jgi:hypothetical protein
MSSFRDVIKEQFQQDNCTANVAYDATQEKDHTGRERERAVFLMSSALFAGKCGKRYK